MSEDLKPTVGFPTVERLEPFGVGWNAFMSLFGEDMDAWPRSLSEAVKANHTKVLVRLWCSEHKVLVAAVFATASGPLLVTSNFPRRDLRSEPLGWSPGATLVLDHPRTPLYCNKCRAPRKVDGLPAATALALTKRRIDLHV